ncbi:MAG: NAD(P)H-dependent oxidoreductase [Parasporobacterium sp.]|nr:NAD(P)H-dependent oxidoreductase [Parasporobacterium sp.]
MKVLVLNGSPSGNHSVTLYTVYYIQKYFPECSFEILQVGQQIRRMEGNFTPCIEKLEAADLILFCYPVYTFLVPSQLHRFIELMKEHQVQVAGKFASQITTSLHFYDITAHAFVEENCKDLGMRYITGLSADMEDLQKEQGRREALDYFRFVLWNMRSGAGISAGSAGREGKGPASGKRICVVADFSSDTEGTLRRMTGRFQELCSQEVQVTDIGEFPFAGGCLGCFHCASDGKCIYKDGFDDYLRTRIQSADATVYAFTVKDHSMGYRFKLFDDRQFCNGHRTVTMGKPVGYLVDGDLSRENNLKILIESRAQVGGNFLAGIASSQEENADAGIGKLAGTLEYAMEHDYRPPKNFYGVGGLKIFRDLIYQMRGLMKADHIFYKQHGFYDFPQKRKGRIAAMYLVGGMMRNKKLQKKIGGKMTEGMILPYKNILKKY